MAAKPTRTRTVKPAKEADGSLVKLPVETEQLLDAIAGKETAQRMCQWPKAPEPLNEAEYQDRVKMLKRQAKELAEKFK